jgi:hypothetical protein
MITFISRHLVKNIEDQIREKMKILKHNSFLYFDDSIQDSKKLINRVNGINAYGKEEVLPTSWYTLHPKTLIKIYENLKYNKFFIYKTIDGKSHKMRIKNRK